MEGFCPWASGHWGRRGQAATNVGDPPPGMLQQPLADPLAQRSGRFSSTEHPLEKRGRTERSWVMKSIPSPALLQSRSKASTRPALRSALLTLSSQSSILRLQHQGAGRSHPLLLPPETGGAAGSTKDSAGLTPTASKPGGPRARGLAAAPAQAMGSTTDQPPHSLHGPMAGLSRRVRFLEHHLDSGARARLSSRPRKARSSAVQPHRTAAHRTRPATARRGCSCHSSGSPQRTRTFSPSCRRG